MKEENLIHVRLGYEEALDSKRDLLSSEAELLQIIQIIKRYRILREEEIKSKLQLYKKIKNLLNNIRKLERILPKIKIPDILNHEGSKMDNVKIKTQKLSYSDKIEKELQEIQEKLRTLQR